ncbi:hypothetical protein AAHA92_28020 [Salvia divinorum]|uniref:Uncharacterized protein n=1 Tax=Salvia divinorum TaxID=28513 RepID=A0ABD1G5Q9_SALDI
MTFLTSLLVVIDLSGLIGLAPMIQFPSSPAMETRSLRQQIRGPPYWLGSIPGSTRNLIGMRMLDLQSNRLSLDEPESITKLSNLEQLDCLKELDLSNNSLSKRIPSSITRLRAISIIYLDNNQLEIEIYEEFGFELQQPRLQAASSTGKNATSMESLKLQKNHLTGKIADDFLKFKNLLRPLK